MQGSRRVIDAKVPSETVKQDNEGELHVQWWQFLRSHPLTNVQAVGHPHRKRFIPKEIRAARCDTQQSEPSRNKAEDLSDYSGSFSEDATESDDSEVTDVSPLNTHHSPDVETAIHLYAIFLLTLSAFSLYMFEQTDDNSDWHRDRWYFMKYQKI